MRAYQRHGQRHREQRGEQKDPKERRRLAVSVGKQQRDDLVSQDEHQREGRDDYQRQFTHGVQPDRNNGAPIASRRQLRYFRDQRAAERSGQHPKQRQLKQSDRVDRESGGREIARDHEIMQVGLRGLRNAAYPVRQRIADLSLEQRPVEGAFKRSETPPDIDEHNQDLQRSVNRRGPDYGPDTVEGERRADNQRRFRQLSDHDEDRRRADVAERQRDEFEVRRHHPEQNRDAEQRHVSHEFAALEDEQRAFGIDDEKRASERAEPAVKRQHVERHLQLLLRRARHKVIAGGGHLQI